MPVLLKDGILPMIMSNNLNFVALSYYWHLTFRGYASKDTFDVKANVIVLPFLRK